VAAFGETDVSGMEPVEQIDCGSDIASNDFDLLDSQMFVAELCAQSPQMVPRCEAANGSGGFAALQGAKSPQRWCSAVRSFAHLVEVEPRWRRGRHGCGIRL
jgi:hypothetical protein